MGLVGVLQQPLRQFEEKYWETDLVLDDELDEGMGVDETDSDYIL
jgi:hypothetical protein